MILIDTPVFFPPRNTCFPLGNAGRVRGSLMSSAFIKPPKHLLFKKSFHENRLIFPADSKSTDIDHMDVEDIFEELGIFDGPPKPGFGMLRPISPALSPLPPTPAHTPLRPSSVASVSVPHSYMYCTALIIQVSHTFLKTLITNPPNRLPKKFTFSKKILEMQFFMGK